MDMKQCVAGHFYDADKHASCPYCNPAVDPLGVTVPLRTEPDFASDEKTMALNHNFNPVVGWLVCVSGPDRGKDYVVRNQRNYVGRARTMDIRVESDGTVSNESAVITYDQRKRAFLCTPEKGHAIVRVNGEILNDTIALQAKDRIEIGNTVLMLLPLCDDTFDWDWEPDEK